MSRIYTLEEVLALLAGKIDEPAEGLAGQFLATNGNGGRFWSGNGQTVAAQKLRIRGRDYTVRTGASGAEGYLTIGANNIWLDTDSATLDLGGETVTKLWKGTALAYERNAARSVIFDNGWVDGIGWGGNLLTRPSYTSQGRFDFSNVDSDGYMKLSVSCDPWFSEVSHNTHVCTTNFVSIPANATKLKIEVSYPRRRDIDPVLSPAKPSKIIYGLLPATYKNAIDDSLGGQLQTQNYVYELDHQTLEMTLGTGIAGTDTYRVVINMVTEVADRDNSNLSIYKVWFE